MMEIHSQGHAGSRVVAFSEMRCQRHPPCEGRQRWLLGIIEYRSRAVLYLAYAASKSGAHLIHHRTEVNCPWQYGRIERFFGTLKAKPMGKAIHSLAQLQRGPTAFVLWFNHLCPHQNIGGLTPAQNVAQRQDGKRQSMVRGVGSAADWICNATRTGQMRQDDSSATCPRDVGEGAGGPLKNDVDRAPEAACMCGRDEMFEICDELNV